MSNFVINNDRLIKSSNEYSSSSDTYKVLLDQLKQALESLNWDDSMGGEFSSLVPGAIENLEKIKDNLENNSKMFKDISRTASSYVDEMKSNIQRLGVK